MLESEEDPNSFTNCVTVGSNSVTVDYGAFMGRPKALVDSLSFFFDQGDFAETFVWREVFIATMKAYLRYYPMPRKKFRQLLHIGTSF
jgi:hypothetical protein